MSISIYNWLQTWLPQDIDNVRWHMFVITQFWHRPKKLSITKTWKLRLLSEKWSYKNFEWRVDDYYFLKTLDDAWKIYQECVEFELQAMEHYYESINKKDDVVKEEINEVKEELNYILEQRGLIN